MQGRIPTSNRRIVVPIARTLWYWTTRALEQDMQQINFFSDLPSRLGISRLETLQEQLLEAEAKQRSYRVKLSKREMNTFHAYLGKLINIWEAQNEGPILNAEGVRNRLAKIIGLE